MRRDEAVDSAKKLWELFPKIGEAQADYWARVFENYSVGVVEKAMFEYADRYSDFVDRQSFRTLLDAMAGTAPTAERRLEKEKAEVVARQHARKAERERYQAAKARIDRMLDPLPDTVLDVLKGAAIRSRPDLTDFLGQCDPKSSQILRSLMAAEWKKEQLAEAR